MYRSVILSVLLITALPGCILAPFIQSYKQIGISEADRQKLLEDRVQTFQRALYWGRTGDALALTEDQGKEDLRKYLRSVRKDEKLVEAKVDYVEYAPDSMEADVEVIVKYYAMPYLIVHERIERQAWKFSYVSGWQFASREVVEDPGASSLGRAQYKP